MGRPQRMTITTADIQTITVGDVQIIKADDVEELGTIITQDDFIHSPAQGGMLCGEIWLQQYSSNSLLVTCEKCLEKLNAS